MDDLAPRLQGPVNAALVQAKEFTQTVEDSTGAVADLGNATKEKKDEALTKLNAALDTALAHASSFEKSVDSGIKAFLLGIGDKLGINDSKAKSKGSSTSDL